MGVFKDFTFHWWQIGVMKVSLIAFGILIGSHWADFFGRGPVIVILWIAFIIPAIYSALVALKQVK